MNGSWTLVTGASGFVGARLVKLLVERGHRVKAFVRPGSSLAALRGYPEDRFQLAFGDVTVEHTVFRALSSCDALIHAAAEVKLWDPDPSRIIAPAKEGTRATLEAARRRGLRKVVVTGSIATLGLSRDPASVMDEEHEFDVDRPDTYMRAKRAALVETERALDRGVPVVIVQPSAILGPGDGKPTPVGQLVVRCLQSRGNMPAIEGGLNFVDVDDVAEGHLLALEKGVVGQRYILGGVDVTFKEFLTQVSRLAGFADPRRAPSRGVLELVARFAELWSRWSGTEPFLTYRTIHNNYGAYSYVSSAKATKELGYSARPLRETLIRSVRWFVEHGFVPEPLADGIRLELRLLP